MGLTRLLKRIFCVNPKEQEPRIEVKSDRILRFTRCSHLGPQTYVIYLWEGDEYIEFDIKKDLREGTDGILEKDALCATCILKDISSKSIRCCVCGKHISPGDSVALYIFDRKFKKERTTIFEGQAIGCLRSSCVAADYCGSWTGTTIKLAFND